MINVECNEFFEWCNFLCFYVIEYKYDVKRLWGKMLLGGDDNEENENDIDVSVDELVFIVNYGLWFMVMDFYISGVVILKCYKYVLIIIFWILILKKSIFKFFLYM